MNDNGELGAGIAVDETSRGVEGDMPVKLTGTTMNGERNHNVDPVTEADELTGTSKQPADGVDNAESVEVPIGQISYGHDGESINESPSLDYSGRLDEPDEGAKTAGESFLSGLCSM